MRGTQLLAAHVKRAAANGRLRLSKPLRPSLTAEKRVQAVARAQSLCEYALIGGLLRPQRVLATRGLLP
jgi:hypothetical protein